MGTVPVRGFAVFCRFDSDGGVRSSLVEIICQVNMQKNAVSVPLYIMYRRPLPVHIAGEHAGVPCRLPDTAARRLRPEPRGLRRKPWAAQGICRRRGVRMRCAVNSS